MKTKKFVVLGLVIAVLVVFVISASAKDNNDNKYNANEKLCELNTLSSIQGVNAGSDDYVPDEIIVKFKKGVKDEKISKLNLKHGTSVIYTSPAEGFKRLKISKGKTVSEMVKAYRSDPDVEYAEPDYVAHSLMVPNDPYYKYQWNLYNPLYGGINAEQAWNISTGNNVTVAVLYTGVAYENYCEGTGSRKKCYYKAPDLANTCFKAGYDYINNDAHPNDDNSHGTHVAGTIAQKTNNGVGAAGVAFNACIMPVKVLDKSGSGSYSQIANGIYYAANNGAKVISMSLGGTYKSTTLENALKYAYNKKITIVAASGNNGINGLPNYPAAYDAYVIAVGATRYDNTRASYSTAGSYVDISAPGGDLSVDQNGDKNPDGILQNTFNPNTKNTADFGYWLFQGTSMATPHVSGVAALILQKNPSWTPEDVRTALQKTAADKGTTGWDKEYGWGIVNAYAAVNYVK